MSRLAIVIPTYNNLPELRRCLAALEQQSFKDFTAYVCVDGSTDGTWEYLMQVQLPFLQALRYPDGKNRGRSAARNLVLPYLSKHEWLVFLDSDSIPLPDWLEQFMAAAPTSEEVLLGQILYFSEDNPNPWAEYLQWREKKRGLTVPRSFHFVPINAMVPAQAFLKLGGMDEKIRRYGLEDAELGYRLSEAGLKFRYVPAARVWSLVQYKPLSGIIRLYDMAQHNLPYLHQKHPRSREEMFGGKWLYLPTYRLFLQMLFQPMIARWILRKLEKYPRPMRRWAVRYLVAYAIGRGFWRKKLSLPPLKAERPSP